MTYRGVRTPNRISFFRGKYVRVQIDRLTDALNERPMREQQLVLHVEATAAVNDVSK
jgi:hypothetical protein